jgi:hypothetical protein
MLFSIIIRKANQSRYHDRKIGTRQVTHACGRYNRIAYEMIHQWYVIHYFSKKLIQILTLLFLCSSQLQIVKIKLAVEGYHKCEITIVGSRLRCM